MLHFDPRYVYMYKGFTHPRYRGRRLHAIGMTLALRHYRSRFGFLLERYSLSPFGGP